MPRTRLTQKRVSLPLHDFLHRAPSTVQKEPEPRPNRPRALAQGQSPAPMAPSEHSMKSRALLLCLLAGYVLSAQAGRRGLTQVLPP